MKHSTVIERTTGGDILVMLPSGRVVLAVSPVDAIAKVNAFDRTTSKRHAVVVNVIEWRGFASHEVPK
jgi:hypothetical protein